MTFQPELGLDRYSLQARLLPAAIVLLPVGGLIGAGASVGSFLNLTSTFLGSAITYGLATLLAQLGRDLGKRKEPDLYRRWGGKPSTVQLRHRRRAFNSYTLVRYHRKLEELVGDVRMPSAEQEEADPIATDIMYEFCADYLRSRTEPLKHHRLFQENVNFGFRRNLWAMKPLALSLEALCIMATLLLIWLSSRIGKPFQTAWITALVIELALLLYWLAVVKPDWVRLPAEEYARQLIACCEELEPAPTPLRKVSLD